MIKKLIAWTRPRLRWINIGLAAAAYLGNLFVVQAFCQPVGWAAAVLLLAIGAFLLWPWLRSAPWWVQGLALLLQGVALTVCVYCVWFLGGEGHILVLFAFVLLYPALGLVPAIFVMQLLWRGWRSFPLGRVFFILGTLLLLPLQWWASREYEAIAAAAQQLGPEAQRTPAALARVLPRSYMAERIIGMHLRYHTRLGAYDGWRPPLHEPLITLSYWQTGYEDPLRINSDAQNCTSACSTAR